MCPRITRAPWKRRAGWTPIAIILDLEDAVAPKAKPAARDAACRAIAGLGSREVIVRINSLSSAWGCDDLAAVRRARPTAIALPR